VIARAFCAALVVAGCGGNAAQGTPAETGTSSGSSAQSGGARPPDFELPALDGKSVRLSDHLGKDVILIDFWATFCDPCLAAMPHLEQLYQKHKSKGFVVLAISIDGPDELGLVKTEISKLGVTFPVLLDQETRVVALYNPKTSAPYSVLIGRDGNVLVKKEGYTTGAHGALDRDIEAAVGK
jgi:peroxiredoxin